MILQRSSPPWLETSFKMFDKGVFTPKETWKEAVQKMITAYKAPISPQDATVIVDYLASMKGTR
jgi:hypothetical protein